MTFFWLLAAVAWVVALAARALVRRPPRSAWLLEIPQRPWARYLTYGGLLLMALLLADTAAQGPPWGDVLSLAALSAALAYSGWLSLRYGDVTATADSIQVLTQRLRWEDVSDVRQVWWGVRIASHSRVPGRSILLMNLVFELTPERVLRLRELHRTANRGFAPGV